MAITSLWRGYSHRHLPAAHLSGTLTIQCSGIIGPSAFSGCTGLTGTLTIPSTVTDIDNIAFADCPGLAAVDFSAYTGVRIDQHAFRECSSLSSLTFGSATAPTIGADAFTDVAPTGTLYYPYGGIGYDVLLSNLPAGWKTSLTPTTTGVNVKIKYNFFLGSPYLTEYSTYGLVAITIDNPTVFNLDEIDAGRYLIAVGTPGQSGDYITGRYVFDDTDYNLKYGTKFDPPSDNCYISSGFGILDIVTAVRKNRILYVLGSEQVTDYSTLESLVQSGKVKKINLDQENNFAFYFVTHKEGGVDGYFIDSETKGRVYIDDASAKAWMEPQAETKRTFSFNFESEQEFVPKETAKSGRLGDNNQLSWAFIDHTLEIGGTGAMPAEYQDSPPWSGYIANITDIIINNGVTSISSKGFAIAGIKTVTIPESVVSIGAQAFNGASLTSVTVNWKTADALPGLGAGVFSNNLSNAVLHVPAGTQSIYEAADQWKNFGTVKERGIIVQPDPVSKSRGGFSLSLAVPESGTFTATFDVTLPQKFSLDNSATKLASPLASGYELKITAKSDGVWSFEIKPKATRSGSANAFREVVNVAYTVDKSLADGYYELKVNDLNLTLSDGTVIQEEEIVVPVVFNSATAVEDVVGASSKIWSFAGGLYVSTPSATALSIYTLNGALIRQQSVAAGLTVISLERGLYVIVVGNSVKKVFVD